MNTWILESHCDTSYIYTSVKVMFSCPILSPSSQPLQVQTLESHSADQIGLNTYEDNSVIFITGRNQPPLDDIERQARVVFGASGTTLHFDDPEHRPTEEIGYWLSARSPHPPSGVSLSSFSDPRIAAIQKQIREAETVQAIARLRLVWA